MPLTVAEIEERLDAILDEMQALRKTPASEFHGDFRSNIEQKMAVLQKEQSRLTAEKNALNGSCDVGFDY